MSTKFLSPGWRMPRNANQSKSANYSLAPSSTSSAVNFNYTDEFMSGQNPWSLSFWVLWTSTALSKALFFKGKTVTRSMVALSGDSGTAFKFMANGDDFNIPSFQTPSLVTTNKWYNVVITYNGNLTVEVYVDNALEVTHTLGAVLNVGGGSGTNYFQFFQYNNTTSLAPTNMLLNNLSIFDYALSSSQITTLYGNSTNGPGNPMALPSPPKAYYPLGTSAWDGNFLAENNAIGDYVFDTNGNSAKYFNLPKSTVGSDDFTFSFWVKPESYAGGGGDAGDTLLGNTNGAPGANQWNMWIYEPTGRLNLVWYNETNNAGNFMTTNFSFGAGTVNQEWVQVVLTRVGTTVTFYFNGVVDTATAGTLSSSSITLDDSSNATMRLPSPWSGAIYNQDGFYSNLLWHNVGLSSAEVTTLYNNGSPIRTLANIPQNSNLKAWYKLDASEVYNSSTTEWSIDNNAYPSAYLNSLDFVPNDHIAVAASTDFNFGTGDFTISTWVNIDAFGSFPYLFDFRSATAATNNDAENVITFYFDNDRINVYANGDLYIGASGTQLSTGLWYNIILKRESGTLSTHINGGSADQTATYNGNMDTTPKLNIGARGDGINGLNGKFSNFQIFNTALSQTDITSIYNNGTPLSDMSSFTSLVSWYKLNNTTTGIQDSKGSNNGTNNGATEYAGFVNVLAGESSGMSQTNLVQSDLQTVAPYSKYAMNFDGTDYIQTTFNPYTSIGDNTSWTASSWVYVSSVTTQQRILGTYSTATNTKRFWIGIINSGIAVGYGNRSFNPISGTSVIANSWQNIIVTYSTTTGYISVYINGSLNGSKNYLNPQDGYANGDQIMANANITIGDSIGDSNPINGKLSNCTIWNTVLTPSEVREVYNEGLPSNLHNFSGTAPVAWWQLGENSSYVSGWVFADEMPAGNNGTGNGLAETDLVNGVGTTANGVSNSMAVGALVGDAPYSTANALSSGMAVTAKGTNVP